MFYAIQKLFKEIKTINEPKDILATIKKKRLDIQYSMKCLRNWLNFCEQEELMDEFNLHKYRKKFKIPQQHKPDVFVPSKTQVDSSFAQVRDYSYMDYIVMRVLLESGCRITELKYFIETFNPSLVTIENGVACYPLTYLRHNKNSYFMFMSENTFNEYVKLTEELKGYKICKLITHIRRHKLTPMKYYRKYAFTLMIDCEIDMEIANYIQGRVSSNIGVNHYLAKKQIAIKEYKKFLEVI